MTIWNAITAASHVSLIFAALLVVFEVLTTVRHPGLIGPGGWARIRAAGYLALSALVVERVYYVVARLLVHQGYNLWESHPAPELLSAAVACGIFTLWAVIAVSIRGGWAAARVHLLTIGSVVALVWVAVVVAIVGAK